MFTHRNPSGDRATATFGFSARCNSGIGISPSLVLSTRRMIVKPGAEPSTIGDCRVDRFRADLTGLLSSGTLSYLKREEKRFLRKRRFAREILPKQFIGHCGASGPCGC
jgi:hypothetical protein